MLSIDRSTLFLPPRSPSSILKPTEMTSRSQEGRWNDVPRTETEGNRRDPAASSSSLPSRSQPLVAELGCQPVSAELDCQSVAGALDSQAMGAQLDCQPVRSELDALPRPAELDCLPPSAELDPLPELDRVPQPAELDRFPLPAEPHCVPGRPMPHVPDVSSRLAEVPTMSPSAPVFDNDITCLEIDARGSPDLVSQRQRSSSPSVSPPSSGESTRQLPAFLGTLPLSNASRDAMPARPRHLSGDDLDENEEALVQFLQRHITRHFDLTGELPDDVAEALPILEEFSRSTLTSRSFDSLLANMLTRVAQSTREQLNEFIQDLETLPDPDNVIRPVIDKYLRKVDELNPDAEVRDCVRKLLRTLTRMGLACPALQFAVCSNGHMFPADKKGAGERLSCCRGKTERFYYLPRLLQIQQMLSVTILAKAIRAEISHMEEIAEKPRDVYGDWYDGSIFRDVFVPFARRCKQNNCIPIATSTGVDAARVTKWITKSRTPMLSVNLCLPEELRCNSSLLMMYGSMPEIRGPQAGRVRQAIQCLDVFELNLGYLYGVPYWDGDLQEIRHFRVMHLHQTHDYAELPKHAKCVFRGKRDACNRCHVQGQTVGRQTIYLKSTEARLKTDSDTMRRMESRRDSSSNAGVSALEADMYSTGLVYPFGNATQFVLCVMHSLLLNTLPRLWSIISPRTGPKSKKRPLYDQKIEEALGKTFDREPGWAVPAGKYRSNSRTGKSALAVKMDELLHSIRWCTGNGVKPGNCLFPQSWKAHDSLLWTSDFGLAMFHNLANECLRKSGSQKYREFWYAYFSFVDTCNRLLSKCILKDDLPKLKDRLFQAFNEFERVAPSTLKTISVHSVVHLPEIIELFGPIAGFVWALLTERFMLRMKNFVTSTIGYSANIVKNYQLCSATIKLRFAYPDRFKQSTPSSRKLSCMDPCTGTMQLQLSRVRPFKERTMTLSDDDRCHLHQHLCTDDWQHYHDSPAVQHYRKVCRLFRKEVGTQIERFSEMRIYIASFDAFCERVAGMRLLPSTCEVFNEASFGNCLWKANLAENGDEPKTNNHLVMTVGEGWRYLGAIRRLARVSLRCPEPVVNGSTFELECFYCYKWWEICNADPDTEAGGPCGRTLPGYVILQSTSLFSPWFPVEQAVPNNVILVPSVLNLMPHDTASRKRRRVSDVDVQFVCVLGRSNMVPGSLISTSLFD